MATVARTARSKTLMSVMTTEPRKTGVECVVCGLAEIVQEMAFEGLQTYCPACGVRYHHVPDPPTSSSIRKAKGHLPQ